VAATNSTSLPAPSQVSLSIHSSWIKVVHTMACDGADAVGLAWLQGLPFPLAGGAAERSGPSTGLQLPACSPIHN